MLSIKEDLESEEEMPTSISKYTCYACKNGRTYTRKQLCSHFKRVHKGKRMRDMKFHKDYAISCEICWKNFLSKKTYKLHIEKHSNQFICETCAACFKKLSDYTIHLRLHSTENNFKCILCDVVTDTIVEIREHIRKVHSKKILYSCKICRKVFPVHAWHAQHANYHANIRPYRCKICRKRFTYDRYVTIHKNKDHPEKSEEPPAKKPVDAREEKPKKPPKKSHQCVICKNSYYNSGSLNRHMNTHSGNLAVCDFCGKRCLDNMKLKIHRRTHTGEKPYCCTVCGKCFISMERLKEHERVHTGEKPYKCEECGRGFTQKSPLKIHMRTHTGERPYICRLCNKGFISGGSMNIHLKKCDGGPSNRH